MHDDRTIGPIPRRHVTLNDRPVVDRLPTGDVVVGPLAEEVAIVDAVLRTTGARGSLVYVETRAAIRGQLCFRRVTEDTEVIVTGMWWEDDRFWLHVSACGALGIPHWARLREVKDLFIGPDRVAIQILPRAADYINIHPHALHLWSCLTEDVVPNFGAEGSI